MAGLGWYAWTDAVLMMTAPGFIQRSVADQVEHRLDVHRESPPDPLRVDVLELLDLLALERGVVDENVDAPEFAGGGLDHAGALRLFGEVARDQDYAPARGLDHPLGLARV